MATPSAPAVLRLGTRGSDLASWQAREVARALGARHPHVAIETVVIRTSGDRAAGAPFAEIEGTGVFTREIEHALLARTIDLAVHSLKDLPTRLPDGLVLAAVLERADARDALVAAPGMTIDGLPRAARVGSSSLRRRAQLLARRPDLDVRDVRGNVPTRLAKLDRGDYDALVLARAGLQRLGLDERIAEAIATDVVMPAAGQGALAVEVRAEDDRLASLLEPLDHAPTRLATCAERACLGHLEGGCRAPVGVLGTWADGTLTLRAIVASLRGERVVRGSFSAAARTETEAAAAGVELADRLLSDGAAAIISGLRASARAHGEAGRERS